MTSIAKGLENTRQRIAQAASACGRRPQDIHLLAVSKTRPVADIRTALDYGQTHFGESYLQEARQKIAALADAPICWHFIGPIQGNKTRTIANSFDWVHSVDRLKIARRLSAQRDPRMPALNICLQVNISGEASKSGLQPSELIDVANAIAPLPQLRLRGLMCIPQASKDPAEQARQFALLAKLLAELQQLPGIEPGQLDTLSMGMSDDLETAIAQGATWVRIGTAIFGPRSSRKT